MSAEIIAIGSELTTGAKLDTNSQWLSLELSEVGIPVKYHQTMADDLPAMVEVFRTAAARSDWVFITGGLGPTLDDLTRQALAELAGVELVLHQESLDIIRGMFQKRNRTMPERNVVQAMFPLGSEPIPNRRGTAPGIWLELGREGKSPCRLAAMPGVPSEMKLMFREQILPRLAGGGRVIRRAQDQLLRRGGIGRGRTARRCHRPRPRSRSRHHRPRSDDHAPHHRGGRNRPGMRTKNRRDQSRHSTTAWACWCSARRTRNSSTSLCGCSKNAA